MFKTIKIASPILNKYKSKISLAQGLHGNVVMVSETKVISSCQWVDNGPQFI